MCEADCVPAGRRWGSARNPGSVADDSSGAGLDKPPSFVNPCRTILSPVCSAKRGRLMRRMAVAAAIVLAFGATALAQDAKVARGQKVYTDQKCSLCHSIGGHGNAKGPLDD